MEQPWVNIRSASTTRASGDAKIKRPRRARSQRRRQAAPHRLARLYGPRTPVTMTVTIRGGASLWAEVVTDEGRFFVPFDASVFDLVQQIIRGGHQVDELAASTRLTHRRGISALAPHNLDEPNRV